LYSGGHPIIPDLPGADLGISSDGFFDLENQPKRVAVVGTGYIGVELAGIFHTLGSQVTIFSRTHQILRSFDPIIKDTLLKEMQNVGVDFVFESDVRGLSRDGPEGSPIKVHYTSAGKQGETEVDCVLWAVGRLPNTKPLNLEAVGVQTDKRGHVVVDEYQNTSTENIYSLGDVCGHSELTPGKQKVAQSGILHV
jgi:glutathione reductase (NADPH)